MYINVSELTGPALDYAVAKADGRTVRHNPMGPTIPGYWIWEEVPSGKGGVILSRCIYKKIGGEYSPSTNWDQGGPIIEIGKIGMVWRDLGSMSYWYAYDGPFLEGKGDTPLIAAMRCYVSSVLGDAVEIPNGLTSK